MNILNQIVTLPPPDQDFWGKCPVPPRSGGAHQCDILVCRRHDASLNILSADFTQSVQTDGGADRRYRAEYCAGIPAQNRALDDVTAVIRPWSNGTMQCTARGSFLANYDKHRENTNTYAYCKILRKPLESFCAQTAVWFGTLWTDVVCGIMGFLSVGHTFNTRKSP